MYHDREMKNTISVRIFGMKMGAEIIPEILVVFRC